MSNRRQVEADPEADEEGKSGAVLCGVVRCFGWGCEGSVERGLRAHTNTHALTY